MKKLISAMMVIAIAMFMASIADAKGKKAADPLKAVKACCKKHNGDATKCTKAFKNVAKKHKDLVSEPYACPTEEAAAAPATEPAKTEPAAAEPAAPAPATEKPAEGTK